MLQETPLASKSCKHSISIINRVSGVGRYQKTAKNATKTVHNGFSKPPLAPDPMFNRSFLTPKNGVPTHIFFLWSANSHLFSCGGADQGHHCRPATSAGSTDKVQLIEFGHVDRCNLWCSRADVVNRCGWKGSWLQLESSFFWWHRSSQQG